MLKKRNGSWQKHKKLKKISITLPTDMLHSIKDKVNSGLYSSTSIFFTPNAEKDLEAIYDDISLKK